MAQTLFASKEALTQDWLTYIEQEARSLSQSDEFTIDNYADRELLNPEVQAYLMDTFTADDNVQDGGGLAKAVNFDLSSQASFALSFEQNKAIAGRVSLFGFWGRLKEKVRKVFCEVTGTLKGNDDIDWKDIIKLILIALIPAFAGGVPAIVLPIVIALLATLMKYGYGKVCPVA